MSGLGVQAQDKETAVGESQKVSARRPSEGAARRPARSRPPGPPRRRGTHVRTKKPPTVKTRSPWVRETSVRARRPDLRGSTSELAARRPHSPPRDVEAGRSGGARSRGADHAPRCPRRPRYCSRAAPAPRAFPGGGHVRGEGGGRSCPGAHPRTHPAVQPTAIGKPVAVSGAVPRWPRPLLSPARGSLFRPRCPASAAPLTNRDAGRQRARPPTSSRRAPPPRLRAAWGRGGPGGPDYEGVAQRPRAWLH